jgi:hypothetical protein
MAVACSLSSLPKVPLSLTNLTYENRVLAKMFLMQKKFE